MNADVAGLGVFFQAEDGIRDVERSRVLGDVYKRQGWTNSYTWFKIHPEFLFWNFIERMISSYTPDSDPLKNFVLLLQRVGHYLYCTLKTDRIFILELCREEGTFLILRFKVRPKFYFRTTDGGPFLILHFEVRL